MEVRPMYSKETRERDGNKCVFCPRKDGDLGEDLTIHHIVPKRFKGEDKPENCLTVCVLCHDKIEKMYKRLFHFLIKEEFVDMDDYGMIQKKLEPPLSTGGKDE